MLRAKALAVLVSIERAEEATEHRRALAELVVELTDAGMDAFFKKPLELSGPGYLLMQSATVGMAGTKRAMGSAIRSIIGRMSGPQLLSVCASIRAFMR